MFHTYFREPQGDLVQQFHAVSKQMVQGNAQVKRFNDAELTPIIYPYGLWSCLHKTENDFQQENAFRSKLYNSW